jgi:hypothetical protein
MFGPLCQNEQLPPCLERALHLLGNGLGASHIRRQAPEHLLNADVRRRVDRLNPEARDDF